MENYINSLFSINHALQNGFRSILDKYKVSNSHLSRDQLAQIFTQIGLSFLHSQCQLVLENEMLRKYTILVILYKLDHKSVCQLTIKDIPELKRAAGSKPYEDENEIR